MTVEGVCCLPITNLLQAKINTARQTTASCNNLPFFIVGTFCFREHKKINQTKEVKSTHTATTKTTPGAPHNMLHVSSSLNDPMQKTVCTIVKQTKFNPPTIQQHNLCRLSSDTQLITDYASVQTFIALLRINNHQ